MLKNHSHGTMEGLEKYKLRLKSLTVLVDKMENGTLSILELSELEELTREPEPEIEPEPELADVQITGDTPDIE